MLTTITNFFNTSLAALNIYDILIIVLFMLAIVLSIISGIIIISARVKKINTELDKNKHIQNINEKIIQNRLDLIINKLTSVDPNTNNQHFFPLNNIPKETTDTNTQEENICASIDIIKLPPPGVPKTTDKAKEEDDVSEKEDHSEVSTKLEPTYISSLENEVSQDNEIKETPDDQHVDLTSEIENHVINTNVANSSVDINRIDINEDKLSLAHEPELITLDTNNIPDPENGIEAKEININVNDKYNKSSEINVYFTEEPTPTLSSTNLEQTQNDSFEKAPSIPLVPVTDNIFHQDNEIPSNTIREKEEEEEQDTIYDDVEEDYTNPVLQYNESIEKDNRESNPDLKIVNEALNNLNLFSNREKFNITNNISPDGKKITCNITNNDLPLNYKELTRQLLIQRFINEYNYHEENIEIDYSTTLSRDVTYPADIVIFDDKDRPFIVAMIAIPNGKKHFKLLKALVRSLRTPFAVWTNGQNIMFYKNNNGTLEEISGLPEGLNEYENKDKYDSKFTTHIPSKVRNTQPINKVTFYPKEKRHADDHDHDKYNSNKVSNFSKDNYNIYRNQPYSLSQEYQQIINKYRNIRNTSPGRNYQSNYITPSSINPSTIFNQALPINNTFNLQKNFSPSMPPRMYKGNTFLSNHIGNNSMNNNYPCNNNPNLPTLPNFRVNIPPRMNNIPNSTSFPPPQPQQMHPNFNRPPMPLHPINMGPSLNNNIAEAPFLPPQPQQVNSLINREDTPMPINMPPHMPHQAFNNPSVPNNIGNFRNPNISFNHHNLPPSPVDRPHQPYSNIGNNTPPQPLPLPYNTPMPMQNNSIETSQPITNSSQPFNSTVNNRFKSYKDLLVSREHLSEPQEQRLFNPNIKFR